MFNENLTALGLSSKEAAVYLALLRNGPAAASSLAKRLQLKRVSLYSLLESLNDRGLVTYEQTRLGRKYIPHDPECLLGFLEREHAEIKYKMELAKRCVEQLQRISVWP